MTTIEVGRISPMPDFIRDICELNKIVCVTKMVTNESLVAQFYKNKSVFVTGGTGFLGMVIIEKLLFSCSELKNIYILIKPKKGKSIQERIENMWNIEAFQLLKEHKPHALKKIIPVAGDLHEVGMGICEEDVKTLRKEVSVIIHSAANVNFAVTLQESIASNTQSTVKMVELSKTMPNLQAFVYISTAYSNCNRNVIDEKVYETQIPLKSLDYIQEELKENPLSKRLTGGWPNTYSYSKTLAEKVVATEVEVPAAIVRPSIITAASEEPTPGWLSGWSGINHTVAGVIQGTTLVWDGDSECIVDMIPVDYVANLTIVTAWDVCRKRDNDLKKKVKVFNITSGLQNPSTFGQLMYTALEYGKKNYKRQGIPKIFIIKNHVLWQILFFILQVIPAYIIGGLCFLFGDWGRSVTLMKKTRQLINAVGFFTHYQFVFVDHNVRQLGLELNDTDKETFNFNVKRIDWHHYLSERFMHGINKYLLVKEK